MLLMKVSGLSLPLNTSFTKKLVQQLPPALPLNPSKHAQTPNCAGSLKKVPVASVPAPSEQLSMLAGYTEVLDKLGNV